VSFLEKTQLGRTAKALRGKGESDPKGSTPQIKKTIENLRKGRKCSPEK